MVETMQIAVAGSALGILLSLPVALLAARGLIAGPAVNWVVRTLLGFIRAVPDLRSGAPEGAPRSRLSPRAATSRRRAS
jgi:ABC-type phosphate/phosphonate transport system permease subunit